MRLGSRALVICFALVGASFGALLFGCSSDGAPVDVSRDGDDADGVSISPQAQADADAELAVAKSQLQEGQAIAVGRSRLEGFDIEDIVFPEVVLSPQVIPEIPEGPLPGASAMEFIRKGDGDNVFSFDTVRFEWSMFAWSTGEEVNRGSVESRAEDAPVPQALRDAIVGVPVGSLIGVIYEFEMADLPADLDQSDAYYLVVEVQEITAMAG